MSSETIGHGMTDAQLSAPKTVPDIVELLRSYSPQAVDAKAAADEIERLRATLEALLPPHLEWKEKGCGKIVIEVHKEDLRKARAAIAKPVTPI